MRSPYWILFMWAGLGLLMAYLTGWTLAAFIFSAAGAVIFHVERARLDVLDEIRDQRRPAWHLDADPSHVWPGPFATREEIRKGPTV